MTPKYIFGQIQEECVPGASSIYFDQPSMSKERQAFQRRGRSPEEACRPYWWSHTCYGQWFTCNLWKGSQRTSCSEWRWRTRTHVEEEIYMLGPTLLERPRGLLCNRHDARDEESLREPARLLGRVWEDKRYSWGMGGPATLHEKDSMPPKQYEGPASYALTKEEKEIFFECLLSMKVLTGFSSNIKGIINMAEKKFKN